MYIAGQKIWLHLFKNTIILYCMVFLSPFSWGSSYSTCAVLPCLALLTFRYSWASLPEWNLKEPTNKRQTSKQWSLVGLYIAIQEVDEMQEKNAIEWGKGVKWKLESCLVFSAPHVSLLSSLSSFLPFKIKNVLYMYDAPAVLYMYKF